MCIQVHANTVDTHVNNSLPIHRYKTEYSSLSIKWDLPAKYRLKGTMGNEVGFSEIDTRRVKLAH